VSLLVKGKCDHGSSKAALKQRVSHRARVTSATQDAEVLQTVFSNHQELPL